MSSMATGGDQAQPINVDNSVNTPAGGAKKFPLDHLNITVRGQDDRLLRFKVKYNSKLTKLMDTYSSKRGLDPKVVQFLYHDKRITRRHTPASLAMEDGDEIEAMVHMNGGSWTGSF